MSGPRRTTVLARPAAVLAAALALGAAACGGGERAGRGAGGAAVPDSARRGGTVVVGIRAEIPGVDPLVPPPDYMGAQVERYVLFMPLVQLGPDFRFQPWLARSWDVSEDSTRVVFHLRDDVTWSDGKPVTAADVAYTYRKATDPDIPFPNRAYFERWDSVQVVDAHTVRFRIRPYSQFLFGWTQVPILPEHVLGDVPDSALATHPFGTSAPVGDGPFRFVSHEQGDRWVFEANPDFPEELGGRPYVDRLALRVIPDGSTALAELARGDLDVLMNVPPEGVGRVRSDSSLRLLSFPSSSYAFVAWNTRRPLFSDVRVRRALTMAMDRKAMLDAVRHGLGSLATGPLGPWHWAYDSAWRPLPFDPDSARALLAAAGWRDTDGDGVLDRDGRPFRFTLLVPDVRVRRDMAVMMQADLRKVGVDLRPATRDFAALAGAIQDASRPYDAFLLSWNEDLVIDDRDYWSCGPDEGPLQFSGWCDRALDAVMDSIPGAMDRSLKRRLLRTYAETVERAQPYTFLFDEDRAAGVRRGLEGVSMDVRGELRTARSWWVRPGAR
ncbi:MAG TPA: ABC transporter substrate-binding protein [Gemmatimonadota bacterium]|nr:ABC transporter substrate-binding protein [Gemmatimonadota bacterium]